MTYSRIPAEDVIAAYRETGSVWKAGKKLGLAGQTVHERLHAAGFLLTGRKWTPEEDEEMQALIGQALPIGEIAHRLGRTYAGVTCRMNEQGLRAGNKKQKKIPRGGGFDKASMLKHLAIIEKSGLPVTRYCRANALSIEMFVRAMQLHFPDRWASYVQSIGGPPEKECTYCKTVFYPANGKQAYCDRRCSDAARADASYFGGKRRSTIGLAEGICQLCGRQGVKALSSHHILGKENDPENESLIALCSGCHQVVTLLAARTFVDDPVAWESLVSLVWLRKHGKDIASLSQDGNVRVYVEIEVNSDEDEEIAS